MTVDSEARTVLSEARHGGRPCAVSIRRRGLPVPRR